MDLEQIHQGLHSHATIENLETAAQEKNQESFQDDLVLYIHLKPERSY